MGFTTLELIHFIPLCLFYPDGWSYSASMDGTFLNNEVQICMYPTYLNMRGAAGLLIIPIVCLFSLTSLRVSFLMRRTWYSPGLCAVVAASPLVHLWGLQWRGFKKKYMLPPLPPPLKFSLSRSQPSLLCVFKSLFSCIWGHYIHNSSAQNEEEEEGQWKDLRVQADANEMQLCLKISCIVHFFPTFSNPPSLFVSLFAFYLFICPCLLSWLTL